MVDFVGRTTSTVDEAARWGQYFGGVDERAHQRWTMEEARRRYDEANRYNRAEAQRSGDFYQQNAGLTTGMGAELAGLNPINPGIVPPNGQAPTTATATTPGAGPINLRPELLGAPGGDPTSTAPTTPAASAGTLTADQRARLAASGSNPGPVTVAASDLTPAQQRAWQAYQTAGTYDPRSMTRERTSPNLEGVSQPTRTREGALQRLRTLGLDVVNGRLVRTQDAITTDASGLTWPGNVSDDSGLPQVDPSADTAAGVTAPMDEYLQYASEDTSRPLQPTYEMQLIDVANRDAMGRAQLAAAHGRNDIASQAFSIVLQGLAANRQQENLVLLRAAADGSERAASALIARFHGYPPGTVEVHPTDASRQHYVLQVRGADGQLRMATNGPPMTRTDLINRLQTLADAETARAQAEVAAENQRNALDNQTRFAIATLEVQGRLVDTMSEAETAHARMATDRAIAMGSHAQMVTTEDGGIAMRYETVGEDGQPMTNIDWIRTENLPTANVDGNRNQTTPQMVRSRVTGTVGAGAQ